MFNPKAICLAFLVFVAAPTMGMEGVFDRSAEVEKYLAVMNTGTRGDVIAASKELYTSGISDPRLAAAASERLLRDYPTFKMNNRPDQQYGMWLVKALASFGIDEYATTLKRVKNGVKSSSISTECSDELELIPWHRTKNELMASRKHHNEGDNPRASRLINLLLSDDFSYMQMAADRVSWEKVFDPRVMEAMATQLPKYMDSTGFSASRSQTRAMGLYAKLLGYSGDAKYRDVLQQVLKSKGGTLLKKHAKEGLARLQ